MSSNEPDVAAGSGLSALVFDGPPTTPQQLEARVTAIAGALGITGARARVLVSSVILTQMLPTGTLVKGGIGVKLRLGETGTRATRDVDVVARDRLEFLAELASRLQTGWGLVPPSRGQLKKNAGAPSRVAFTGQARPGNQAAPKDVPSAYLMEPYNVTLAFMGNPWAKVPLEVAHDEIAGAEYADETTPVAEQIAAIGVVLGFGEIVSVPLISVEQQIAQKIHAATEPGSSRAHDLVDLQLLWHAATVGARGLDLQLLAQLCQRTFVYRDRHAWPPAFAMPAGLDEAYVRAREEAASNVSPPAQEPDLKLTLTDAGTWLSERIELIADASPGR